MKVRLCWLCLGCLSLTHTGLPPPCPSGLRSDATSSEARPLPPLPRVSFPGSPLRLPLQFLGAPAALELTAWFPIVRLLECEAPQGPERQVPNKQSQKE